MFLVVPEKRESKQHGCSLKSHSDCRLLPFWQAQTRPSEKWVTYVYLWTLLVQQLHHVASLKLLRLRHPNSCHGPIEKGDLTRNNQFGDITSNKSKQAFLEVSRCFLLRTFACLSRPAVFWSDEMVSGLAIATTHRSAAKMLDPKGWNWLYIFDVTLYKNYTAWCRRDELKHETKWACSNLRNASNPALWYNDASHG